MVVEQKVGFINRIESLMAYDILIFPQNNSGSFQEPLLRFILNNCGSADSGLRNSSLLASSGIFSQVL